MPLFTKYYKRALVHQCARLLIPLNDVNNCNMHKVSLSRLKYFAAGLITVCALSAYRQSSPNAGAVEFKQILGADISFIPQLESEGRKFYDNGISKDPF